MLDELPNSIGEALASNSIYYFNNSLSYKGHLCARQAVSGKCHYCVRERQRKAQARLNDRIKKGQHVVQKKSDTHFHGLSRTLQAWMFKSAKSRAKKRGLDFSIDITDIVIPTYCPVLGIELDLTWGGVHENDIDRSSKPSIDRIDSSKGYVKGNIAVISYRANLIKGNGVAEEHRQIARFIKEQYEVRGWEIE